MCPHITHEGKQTLISVMLFASIKATICHSPPQGTRKCQTFNLNPLNCLSPKSVQTIETISKTSPLFLQLDSAFSVAAYRQVKKEQSNVHVIEAKEKAEVDTNTDSYM